MSLSSSDYEALAATTPIEEITNNELNQRFLRLVKSNDPGFDEVHLVPPAHGAPYRGLYRPRSPEEAGWLGYFARHSTVIKSVVVSGIWTHSEAPRIQCFFRELAGNQTIERIHLTHEKLWRIADSLGAYLLRNNGITELEFDGCFISDDAARILGPALHGCGKLKTFKLTARESDGDVTEVTDEPMAHFVSALATLSCLKELELERVRIGPRCCSILGGLLRSTKNLNILDLRRSSIDDECLGVLTNGLEHCKSLWKLNLFGNEFGDEGIIALINGLIRGRVGLKWLDISGANSPSGIGVPDLLRSACPLETLELDHNDEQLAQIGDALQVNRTLKKLVLGSPMRNTEGWISFERALCDASSISNTFMSNHVLEIVEALYEIRPWFVSRYLLINKAAETKWQAAVVKIVMSHDHLDMSPFFPRKLDMFPYVVQWFDNAATIVENENLGNIVPGCAKTLPRKKLASVFQFIRAMPMEYVNAATGRTYKKRKRM